MRNKLTKFLTSECPPKGMRQFAKTWKYAACMLLAFILGIGQMWAEDFTISNICTGSYLSPGNIVKVTPASNTSASSGRLDTKSSKTGGFTVSSNAPGVYVKSFTFTDSQYSGNKKGTITCENGGTLVVDANGKYTITANANATSVEIKVVASSSGDCKITGLSVIATNGTANNIETLSGFSFSAGTFSFTSKVNGSSVTPTVGLTSQSSSSWSASSSNITAPSSNDSKTITVSAISGYHLKYVAFYDSNCRLSLVEKSSTGGTVNGASWTAADDKTTAVTFKNGISTSITITNVFVVTEADAAATKHTVTINPNGGSYASTPDGWTESAGVYTKEIASGTSFSAPAGLTKGTDDLTWKDGSDNDVTFPVSITGDITFVAQWAPHAASSDATLSALSVAGSTLNETFDPATTAYTITLPFYGAMPVVGDVTATKNDPNAEDPEVSISSNVITIHCEAEDGTATKDYTITVTIAPAPASSSSINIEQLILDNSKAYNIGAALDAAHIGYVSKDALDSLKSVAEKADRNEPYLGLKFKTSTSKVTIIVPDGEYLKVKFGYIDGSAGLKVSVNGSAAAAPSLTSGVYTLAASAGVKEVVFTQTGSNKTVVYKQIKINEDIDAVTLPWLITYTVGEHGTCAKAKETWKGSALTLPVVTPESGWDFDGWFTAASAGTKVGDAGDSYTPTADVELFAQYTAQASPYDLTSLTYKIGTGAATNVGYTDGTYTYNIVLPYKASYDAITVTPVLKEPTSYLKGDEVLTVSSLPGAAIFTVVEAGGASEQLYTVNFTKAAKDGTSIFKAELTSPIAATYSGLYVDDENSQIALSNDGGKYKFAGTSNFIKMALTGGTFATNDKLTMTYSANPTQGELAIYDNTDKVAGTAFENNTLDFPAGANGLSTLYIRRTGANNFNGWVLVAEVTRVINPVLKAITFAGVDATVNEGAKTVTVTVPNATDLGTMAVVPTIFRNAPHATTPEAVTTNGGEWVEGSGNTYRIMDKDGDYTDYTVTITRAAVSHDATLSALTVDGNAIALEDGVYTYAYEYETGTAVSPAPVVAATAHDANAKSVEITQASDKKGTATVVVTAEDNFTTQTYTINFSISTKIKVVIFDGNDAKATAIKGSPHATGASWVVADLSADDDDKGTSYASKIATGGSTSASKNISVTVPVNFKPYFEIAQATNKNGTERTAFITTTANGSGTKLYELANSVTNTPTKGMSAGLTEEATYYIHSNASINFYEVILYLEPLAPKAATPTLSGLADLAACTLGTDELTVTASDLDGGTAHYQWYKVVEGDDPDEAVGTDANTYAPAVAGNYYVVVTNQKDGCRDNSKKSDEVTVSVKTHTEITVAPLNQRATVGNNATLSVTAIGDGILHYTWYTCDDELGTNPVAVDPANDAATYEVTVTAAMNQWYKVTVHSDCGEDQSATAKVSEFVPATPANVTESIVWDWTSAAWPASGEVQFTDKTEDGTDLTPAYELLADADAIVPNNAAFRSDMLYGKGQYVWRSGNKFFQGTAIKFTTEVAGRVRVYYRSTGNNKHIQVKINGTLAGTYETGDFRWSDYVDVPVGDVEIICTSTDANKSYTRIQKIEFQTPSYVRTEMLGNGVYGTICVDHNVLAGGVRGVTVYEIAGREPQYGKIAFDEVTTEMEAGVPYVFIAHGNEMALYYGETKVDNPVNGNGMYGTFTAQTLTDLDGIYYFAKSALWSCVDLTSLNLPANRAYVKLSEIDYLSDPNPAPGRKRILLGVNGQNAATDLGNVQGDEVQSTKVLINGQLFILRGEKMYDATGRMVK